MPVSGHDLIKIGFPRGKALGLALEIAGRSIGVR